MFRLRKRSVDHTPAAPDDTPAPTAARPQPAAPPPAPPADDSSASTTPVAASTAGPSTTHRPPRPPLPKAAAPRTVASYLTNDHPDSPGFLARSPAPSGGSDSGAPGTGEEHPVPLNPSAPAFSTPALLLRSAHVRQGLLTALALAVAAALTGRPLREVLLVAVTVLVGQTILGWHNDLVDAERDHRHDAPDKPVAQGLLEVGTLWYAIGVAALALVPLAVAGGINAGICYLLSVVVGVLGNISLRDSLLSWAPWAISWALYVPFLSQGGWGGQATGSAPDPTLVALAAGVGVCVHLLTSLPGLVADHKDGSRSLPLRLALWMGAPRLLWIAGGALVALVLSMTWVARQMTQGG